MGRRLRQIDGVKFASALSLKPDWTEAVEDLAAQTRDVRADGRLDLVFLFVHVQHLPNIQPILEAVMTMTGAPHLVGCCAGGIIGVDREIEQRPAVSLLGARLPGVGITPFRITEDELEQSTGPGSWHFNLELQPDPTPNLVLFGDPYTVQVIHLLDQLTEAYPNSPIIGGLASGGNDRGIHRLFIGAEAIEEGAVGVALTGRVALHALVSQGCRPIGEPLVITRAEKNIILEMAGQPPIKILQKMLPSLPQRDQQLVRNALLLGRVVNEYQEDYRSGDFLIRNLLGSDPQSGALAVGDFMRTGQTVQFQVRDGQSAHDDLWHLLARLKQQLAATPPAGALILSCLGRGLSMYGEPSHDIRLLQRFLGPLPAAGLFCNGEIGPVGGRSYVHGFTSVVGVFTAPAAAG
jgi:small ligand-binding sensory domain FIST